MIGFSENKTKKRDSKKVGKQSTSKPALTGGAVWHDESVDGLQVNIENTSRLRKLKRKEAEAHITGRQYAERLQE